MKKDIIAAVAIIMTAGLAQAGIVYQDNFDGDGLDVNTGIGGGAVSTSIGAGAFWSDDTIDGVLYNNNGTAGWGRSYLTSANSFSVTGGFTLTVNYTASNNLDERFSIALVDATGGVPEVNTLADDAADRYSIGLNISDTEGVKGLNFSENTGTGTGNLVNLSTAQAVTFGTHTLVLTVTPDDQYSYSIDGAAATTGEIVAGAGTFDLTRDYMFAVYGQDDGTETRTINSVTIAAIPEPATLGLVAMVGTGLIAVRRFFII